MKHNNIGGDDTPTHNNVIPLDIIPEQGKQRVMRTYYSPSAKYLLSSAYKRIVGERVQSMVQNPLEDLLKEHNPLFHSQATHNEIDLSGYGVSKWILGKFLANHTHITWYELVIILMSAGLEIDTITLKPLTVDADIDTKMEELLSQLKNKKQ